MVDIVGKSNDRQRQKKSNKGTFISLWLLQEPAWAAMSSNAQILYVWLKLEWRGSNKCNNGNIRLSCRQAASCIGVSINTAAKAFHELQRHGFIVVTQVGSLGVEGEARGPRYELTELPTNRSQKKPAQLLFRKWSPDSPFYVAKHNINNPYGPSGKPKLPS